MNSRIVLQKLIYVQQTRNDAPSVEPRGSLPCTQEAVIDQPDGSSPYNIYLSISLHNNFYNQTKETLLYQHLFLYMRVLLYRYMFDPSLGHPQACFVLL
jgi:hypothetical protein